MSAVGVRMPGQRGTQQGVCPGRRVVLCLHCTTVAWVTDRQRAEIRAATSPLLFSNHVTRLQTPTGEPPTLPGNPRASEYARPAHVLHFLVLRCRTDGELVRMTV